MNSNGSNPRRLTHRESCSGGARFSLDGTKIVFHGTTLSSYRDQGYVHFRPNAVINNSAANENLVTVNTRKASKFLL